MDPSDPWRAAWLSGSLLSWVQKHPRQVHYRPWSERTADARVRLLSRTHFSWMPRANRQHGLQMDLSSSRWPTTLIHATSDAQATLRWPENLTKSSEN